MSNLNTSSAPLDLSFLPLTGIRKGSMLRRYLESRRLTEQLCEPLIIEDYGVQPMLEASPPKWHLAHTTWFFERFFLKCHSPGYKPFHPSFEFIFNSYYEAIGPHLERSRRGLLSRPSVDEIYRYRHFVDRAVATLIEQSSESALEILEPILTLGIHHEEQHQELLLTDIKQIFWCNPLRPSYLQSSAAKWKGSVREVIRPAIMGHDPGFTTLGAQDDPACFDNEKPKHRIFLEAFQIHSLPVTCGEFLEFIDEGGYRNAALWLSAGWDEAQKQKWEAPLYWEKMDGRWWVFTMEGMSPLKEDEPVCHISFYEADAFSRWREKRLPTESEWEYAAPDAVPVDANSASSGVFHPIAPKNSSAGFYGNVWEWTASPYVPYPGFEPLPGDLSEYNGKFMCGQFVLRGGSCITPPSLLRRTYRNFFPPETRWQFSGMRLAV